MMFDNFRVHPPSNSKGLRTLIGDRAPRKNDWFLLVDSWCVTSNYTLVSVAPSDVKCKVCWDHNVCCECLGRYPLMCECKDGKCIDCKK